MVRRRDRILALVMALTFLGTTVGVGGLFIWQIVQENKAASQEDTVNRLLQDIQPMSCTTGTAKANGKGVKQGAQMNDFQPITKIEQLTCQDLKIGTGQEVKASDMVTVDYTGAVAATGKVFQSSLEGGEPITFSLGGVITGWRDGLVGMKVGGTRRLLIPAVQAYGSTPPAGSGIPADADLVFDVTLHSIGSTQQ